MPRRFTSCVLATGVAWVGLLACGAEDGRPEDGADGGGGVDPVALEAPDLVPESDTGESDTDDVTRDASPVFTGVVPKVFRGAMVELVEESTVLGAVVIEGDEGSYRITSSPLSDGRHQVAVRVLEEGVAGESSPARTVTIDTVPPPAITGTPDLASQSDTGISTADDITSYQWPLFVGPASAALPNYRIELLGGTNVIGSGASQDDGSYSVRAERLDYGSYEVKARQLDLAGNAGPPSKTLWVVVAPLPSITLLVDARNDTGIEHGSRAHPFDTIQEGIDAAQEGDVVGVVAGEYFENLSMKSGVKVVGQGPHVTFIRGASTVNGTVRFIDVSDSLIDGFTIAVDRSTSQPGIDRAVVFGGTTDRTTIFQNNVIVDVQYGIFVGPPAAPVIQNNVIDGRRHTEQAIYIGNTPTSPLIRNNVILDHRLYGIHVVAGGSPEPVFEHNAFWGNGKNFHPIDLVGVDGNIEVDPLFVSLMDRDYHLQPGSPLVDAAAAGQNTPRFDGDRDPRPVGAGNDIGVDEVAPMER